MYVDITHLYRNSEIKNLGINACKYTWLLFFESSKAIVEKILIMRQLLRIKVCDD